MKTGAQTIDILATMQVGASPIEQLAPGLTFQRLYDGQIMAFRFTDQTRATIDAWTERASAEATAIPEGKMSVAIYDFSACKYFTMSAYIRQKSMEMASRFSYVEGVAVVVVPRSLTTQLAALFLRLLKVKVQTRLFFTYEEGLHWLKETTDRQPGSATRP